LRNNFDYYGNLKRAIPAAVAKYNANLNTVIH
jgi:hypothetical protein